MKALVLAGGNGTRLRPFTHSMPKQLVPVANKPVLAHCLENIRNIGVEDIGIVVGDRHEEISSKLGDGGEFGVNLTYIKQKKPLGLANCVDISSHFLGDDDFIVYLGDNIIADGILEAVKRFDEERPDAQVMVVRVSSPQEFGVAEIDYGNVVRRLEEKPDNPRTDLAVVGVYFFTSAIHESIRSIRPSWRGELEITDAMQHLIDSGKCVTAHLYSGLWQDIGNSSGLLECNRLLLERLDDDRRGYVDYHSTVHGKVTISAGAVVSDSELIGPLTIGNETRVIGSRIGPGTSLGRGCSIEGSDIESSIILDNARVAGVRKMRDSVIGRRSTVISSSWESGSELVIGDDTRVRMGA